MTSLVLSNWAQKFCPFNDYQNMTLQTELSEQPSYSKALNIDQKLLKLDMDSSKW